MHAQCLKSFHVYVPAFLNIPIIVLWLSNRTYVQLLIKMVNSVIKNYAIWTDVINELFVFRSYKVTKVAYR